MSSLSFAALRRANVERFPLFKDRHGANAHCENWTPAQCLQALVGEVGEYANFRKKFERGDITQDEFLHAAAKELADVQTYLDILALVLGIDLGQATIDKFNEVSSRIGVDVWLS